MALQAHKHFLRVAGEAYEAHVEHELRTRASHCVNGAVCKSTSLALTWVGRSVQEVVEIKRRRRVRRRVGRGWGIFRAAFEMKFELEFCEGGSRS